MWICNLFNSLSAEFIYWNQKSISMFYFCLWTLKCLKLLRFALKKGNNITVIQSQYDCCCWSDDARSQGISSQVIGLVSDMISWLQHQQAFYMMTAKFQNVSSPDMQVMGDEGFVRFEFFPISSKEFHPAAMSIYFIIDRNHQDYVYGKGEFSNTVQI